MSFGRNLYLMYVWALAQQIPVDKFSSLYGDKISRTTLVHVSRAEIEKKKNTSTVVVALLLVSEGTYRTFWTFFSQYRR